MVKQKIAYPWLVYSKRMKETPWELWGEFETKKEAIEDAQGAKEEWNHYDTFIRRVTPPRK